MSADTRTLGPNAPSVRQITTSGAEPQSRAGELCPQARDWAHVARQALENCKRGEEAALELERRRNGAGQ
jgi:hypothetical protein